MYLGKASKIFKAGCLRTLNFEIETVGRILLSSNNLCSDTTNHYLMLHRPKYSTCDIRPHNNYTYNLKKQLFSSLAEVELVDSNTFEKVCDETLNSLADYFDDLVASDPKFEKADVVYGVGVLTIDLGKYGTYVINRQSPNKQIWLSSPSSGPKRFDYSVKEDCWIYKHDGQTLHYLLKMEFESILGKQLQISNCSHSTSRNNC